MLLTGLYTTCLLRAVSLPDMGSSSVAPTPQGPKPELKATRFLQLVLLQTELGLVVSHLSQLKFYSD